MLALAILTLAGTAVLYLWPLPWAVRPVLLSLAALTLLVGLAGGSPATVRAAGAVLIALFAAERIHWVPPTLEVADRGRVEGRVVASRSTEQGGWVAVDGELDLRRTEACRCTTIVRLRSGAPAPEGAWIIAFGTARRPGLDASATIEQSWMRSRSALFVLTADHVATVRPPPPWMRYRTAARTWVRDQLTMVCTAATAATMYAMITGERSVVDEALLSDAAHTGTAHLLAVSGLHVGVILTVLVSLLGGTLHRWWHLLLLTLVVAGYITLTGGEPPAIRAGVMVLLAGLARLREQIADPLNLLGTAMMVEMLVWPEAVIRPSFHLSIGVTAALLWLARPFSEWLLRLWVRPSAWRRLVCSALGLHLAAFVGSALPTAILFDTVSVGAPLVNLIVVPVMSTAFIAAIATVVATSVWQPLGWIVALPLEALHDAGVAVITVSAAAIPAVPTTQVALVATVITAAPFWWMRGERWRSVAIRLLITIALVWGTLVVTSRSADGVVVERVGRQLQVKVQARSIHRQFRIGRRSGRPVVTIPNSRR